ncbi:MAG: hypothetical protein Q9169_007346, partial [Polycauliona sp. 2 TL-2023]
MSKVKIPDKTFILQDVFKPEDKVWSYTVPGLPPHTAVNAQSRIKSISLVSDHSKQAMNLRLEKHSQNRAVDSRNLHQYLSVSFEKFRLQYPTDPTSSEASRHPFQPAPARDSADYIERLLRAGIRLNGTSYHWFGHSNSQLKSKSCFLLAGTAEGAAKRLESLAEFPKKSVAKSSKRVGLLFSAAKFAANLESNRCEDIADVRKDDYIFTDGCGLISTQYAKLLVQKTDIRFRNQRYTPSVFQIRYKGYKGVLTLSPELRGQTLVQFRESMKKFSGCDDPSFSVVDYSKPYSFGFLNDEVILLLHALGVSGDILVKKQDEYLQFLNSVPFDSRAAFLFFSYINEPELAERVVMDGLDSIRPTAQSRISSEVNKLLNKRGERRSRILIPQSRLLFGICDPLNVLKDGECAVRVTSDGDGIPKTVVGTEVLVTRNPCLHPGDLQKFKAVQCDRLSHLNDCIVFPIKGRRPSADLMSGGDLDGDKFFVTWDPDLIPSRLSQAASYQGPKEPVSFKPVTHDDRLVYFARYTNASLGRVKNLYLDWVRLKGAMSAECQELNHLFSRCVDGNRIKVPKHLEDPPKPGSGATPFILDVLREKIGTVSSASNRTSNLEDLSLDRLQLLLSRDDVAFSEFELLQMTMRWCMHHQRSMEEFFEYFDFSKLTDMQKVWLVAQFPAQRYIPDLVMNGLLQSSILHREELQYFRLDHFGLRWKKIFDSSSDRLGRFTEVMGRSLEEFHRKLIVIKVTNRLTLAIYVPKPLLKYQECVVHDSVRLFSFPHSQEDSLTYRRSLPTLINYRLYFDDAGLQLYQTKRQDTWIFIRRPGIDDSSFKAIEDRGDRRRVRQSTVEAGINSDLIISVALAKFSGGLARHMGRVNREPIVSAEVYVISNRDATSMRVLDKWLEFIDTREVTPLFEKQERDYRLADLRDVDWTVEPEYLNRIVRDGDLTPLDSMVGPSAADISRQAPAASRKQRQRGAGRGQRGYRQDNGRADPHDRRREVSQEAALSSSIPDNDGRQTIDTSQDTQTAKLRRTTASGPEKVLDVMTWLLQHHQKMKLKEVFVHLLSTIRNGSIGNNMISIMGIMLDFLQKAPYLVAALLDLGPWFDLPTSLRTFLESRSLGILEAFCLIANEMQVFVVEPFRTFLQQVRHIPLSLFGSLVRHICLVVRSAETALDMLMGVLELESSRLLIGRPTLVKYFVSNLIGVALEHIDEAKDSRAVREDELQLKFDASPGIVSSRLRIDSHSKVRFAANDHVQLTAASAPSNSLETRPYTMDALVQLAEPGKVVFQCFHPLPVYMEECSWKLKNCGSFVTSQAMFEAIEKFVTAPGQFCPIHDQLMGFSPHHHSIHSETGPHHDGETASSMALPESTAMDGREAHSSSSGDFEHKQQPTSDVSGTILQTDVIEMNQGGNLTAARLDLNDSQNKALQAALDGDLVCLWGPPGTGKTHTVAVILEELLKDPQRRILVTAPTHNAVDNVMRKFLRNMQQRNTWAGAAVRVSTDVSFVFNPVPRRVNSRDVRKVAEDLRKYTCDAMMGKDLNENPAGRRKALKQIKESRLIFTTCIGAALGLLKSENFDTVIIDEASQQTEPQSLVPMTKGCTKAILVGDHVQLRATVQQHAQLVGFDISMFERLYNAPTDNARLRKVMLDTQYRMQASICHFSSHEFYE